LSAGALVQAGSLGLVAGALLALAALGALGGCASRSPLRDGPGPNPPAGLAQVPDAVPRVEPVRLGGPNKPYVYDGQRYVPMTEDLPFEETGLASWYGIKFQGLRTSSGEPYDMYAMTAAHRTLPIPSFARVRNPANGREIIVRINDRGPFSKGRVIDLSYTAALKLGVLGGVAPVEVRRLTFAEIRAHAETADAGPAPPPTAPPLAALSAEDLVSAPQAGAAPPGFWLQLGAFRSRAGAAELERQLQGVLADRLTVLAEGDWFRVQAGPWPDRPAAEAVAAQVRRQTGIAAVLLLKPAAP
jgi:rare lipoprotein A